MKEFIEQYVEQHEGIDLIHLHSKVIEWSFPKPFENAEFYTALDELVFEKKIIMLECINVSVAPPKLVNRLLFSRHIEFLRFFGDEIHGEGSRTKD